MDKKEALQRCMKLCSTKEYAPQDIIDKLLSWDVPEDVALEITDTLRKERFLDPARYARYFVNDKVKFNKWGRIKIEMMLRQKQIPADAIRDAFEEFDQEAYLEILRTELMKKFKSIKDTDPYMVRGKLYQFASGRGFEGDLIHKAIDVMLK